MWPWDKEIDLRLSHLERKLEHLLRLTHHILALLTTGHTLVASLTGEINMPQTALKSLPGTDTLTFQTFDNSNPPVDITSRCSYTAVSDGPAVLPATVTGNSVSVTYAAGTANLTITTSDSGGDKIPDVVLACTIAAPAAGITTVTAANPNTTIS